MPLLAESGFDGGVYESALVVKRAWLEPFETSCFAGLQKVNFAWFQIEEEDSAAGNFVRPVHVNA